MLLIIVVILINMIQVPSVSQDAHVTQAESIQENPKPTVLSVTHKKTTTTQPKQAKPQTDAAVVKTEEGKIQVSANYSYGQFYTSF